MSDEHDRFEELSAAFALDALAVDEAAFFRAHLDICFRCQVMVAEFSDVAADLATSAKGEDPDPSLRDRILAAALAASNPPSIATTDSQMAGATGTLPRVRRGRSATPIPHRRRRRVWQLAAAVVVVLAGVGGGIFATSGGIGQPPANCSASTGCTQVMLTSTLTHRAVATVIVSRRSVWIRPEAIPADDAKKQIYVLWEIAGHGSPRPVGAFDVVQGAKGPIAVGLINVKRTLSFAVSLEHGRTIPRRPSTVMAIGRLA